MKVRPQVLVALVALAAISIIVLMFAPALNEVVTAAVAGIVALGMKLLEGE
tara:strand:- start:336 stop:488 length:153 start_codon:yes stop_codon:yes gene_type:complete